MWWPRWTFFRFKMRGEEYAIIKRRNVTKSYARRIEPSFLCGRAMACLYGVKGVVVAVKPRGSWAGANYDVLPTQDPLDFRLNQRVFVYRPPSPTTRLLAPHPLDQAQAVRLELPRRLQGQGGCADRAAAGHPPARVRWSSHRLLAGFWGKP